MKYSGLPTCLALTLLCVTPQADASEYALSGHLNEQRNAFGSLGPQYMQAFSTGDNFSLSLAPVPGDGTIMPDHLAGPPLAEGAGISAIEDVLSGLGQAAPPGSTLFTLNVGAANPPNNAPEPGTLLLLGLAGVVLVVIHYYLSRRR